jgi:quercetin dioxygenase-like cupin family protein
MPSIQRPLSGDVLVFDIGNERERAADPGPMERSGRNARTLMKEGPLRVTLVILGPGGELAEHQAAGPITVQVIEGGICFSTANEAHVLGPGHLLAAGPGIRHRVDSLEGGTFLLTVSHPERDE